MGDENKNCSRFTRKRVIAVICLLAYVGMYLVGGDVNRSQLRVDRKYRSALRAVVFIPAAWVESLITGKPVGLYVIQKNQMDGTGAISVPFSHTADWGI